MQEAIIKRILIVRNDSTTSWETSEYILRKGEIGVGYLALNNGELERPIVKVGDGVHVWRDLSQSEYIFEEDFITNYNFGKHKPTRGFVNTNSMGLTLSEWIKEAFQEVKDPIVSLPTILTTTWTDLTEEEKMIEVGSLISKLHWDIKYIDGKYSYGSIESEDTEAGTTEKYKIYYAEDEFAVKKATKAISEEPTGYFEFPNSQDVVTGDNDYGVIRVHYSWSDGKKPVNSIGEETNKQIIASNSNEEGREDPIYYYSVKGYREGCYFGSVNNTEFPWSDDSNKNSYFIRNNLNKTGKDFLPGTLKYTIKPGATTIIVAVEAGKKIKSILNTTVSAEMFDDYNEDYNKYGNFEKITFQIGGADSTESNIGRFSVPYDVYYYKPAEPYKKEVELLITLGA